MGQTKLKKQAMNDEVWHEIGGTGEPAFANSWVNYGTGYNTAAFMKDALGFVHLKGLIKNGNIGSAAFTLPSGYRPNNAIAFPVNSVVGGNDDFGKLAISSSGAVVPSAPATNVYVYLDGLSFKAES